MKITYHGHSCLYVECSGKRIIMDPFLSGNPASGLKPEMVKADAVVLTHGHGDHFGDTLQIASLNDCPVIATFELATYCQQKGVKAHQMNIGGTYDFEGIKIKLTPAFHSSSIIEDGRIIYMGQPAGVLLQAQGKTLYHAGDTCLFSDMKLIGEMNNIDVAVLPIGDNFTMGPEEAVIAAEWVKAKHVIPVHYNTFPVIQQNGHEFAAKLEKIGIQGHPLKSGEFLEI